MASKKTGENNLNQNQINFCNYYVTEEFFCNGTKSYIKAYPNSSEETARRNASELLTNTDVLNYIDSLLVDMGLNDQRVDKELAKLILQDSETSVKLWAIKEYNNLKARIEIGKQRALDKWDVSKEVLGISAIEKLNKLLWE